MIDLSPETYFSDEIEDTFSPDTAEQEAYECMPIPVECVVCHQTVTAPEKELRDSGWYLSSIEICPILNTAHLNYRMGRASMLLEETERARGLYAALGL